MSRTRPRSSLIIYRKRILVVLCIVAVLYFGIGSLIYGEWFFGLLWDAKFWSLSYWLDGLFYLFSEHTYAVIVVIVVALTLTAVTAKYRDRVWHFVDKVWGWLVASCLLGVFAIALLVYRFERRQYESAVGIEASLAQLDTAMRNMGKVDIFEIWSHQLIFTTSTETESTAFTVN